MTATTATGDAALQQPSYPAPARLVRISAREAHAAKAVGVLAFISIVTMKMGLPQNIEMTVVIIFAGIGYLVATGLARLNTRRLLSYLVICLLLIGSQMLAPSGRVFSIESLLLLIGLYLPFCFQIPISSDGYRQFLGYFQVAVLFVAGCVFVQWLAQLAGMGMPNMEQIIPKGLLYQGYNYIQPIHWGSPYMKPNGFVMLETSHTSQLLAIGILIELCVLRRPIVMAVLGAALLATFGGTGISILLLSSPFAVAYLSRRTIVALIIAAPVLLFAAYELGIIDNLIGRTAEFGQAHSSGDGRFVAPFEFAFGKIFYSKPEIAFFGMGAGQAFLNESTAPMVLNPVTKLVTEFGLFAGMAFFTWFHIIVIRSRAPLILSIAVLLQYDLMNGSLLVPINLYYCLLLCALFRPAEPRRAPADDLDFKKGAYV